jgi:hypothetical protein
MDRILLTKLNAQIKPGSRHTRYLVFHGEQIFGQTPISRGIKEIDDGLAGAMAKELCISLSTLRGLYNCPKNWDDYVADWDSGRSRIPYNVSW